MIGVLVALTVGGGLQQALLVVLVMVAVQQVDNHLVTPIVVGRSVSVHPITVILALIVAGSLGGIPLMFVAIPVTATIKLVLVHLAVTRLPSMSHLAEEVEDGTEPRRGTVAGMARELRAAFERRLAQAQTGLGGRRDVPPASGSSEASTTGATSEEATGGPAQPEDTPDEERTRPTEAVGGP
jgi:hypothetical protein